jgi:hypothetical protein
MSGKKVLLPYKLVNAVSMGTSITSDPTNVQYIDNIGLQITATGTPTGTLEVQGTASAEDPRDGSSTQWDALTFDPALPAFTGAPASILININQFPFSRLRVVYTRTSGTGSLDVTVVGKAV